MGPAELGRLPPRGQAPVEETDKWAESGLARYSWPTIECLHPRVRSFTSDERANRQTGQSEFLERADRAARPPARAAQERRAGGAAFRIAAREQRAGPDALVSAPGDRRHGALDALDLSPGDSARQPLRPAEIPGRTDPVHRRRPR